MENTTIAAIATPQGSGGIAVLRVSGPDALGVAARCFHPYGDKTVQDMPGYTCAYGAFMDGEEMLDDGILTVFRAPKSYTGEDVAELSCHGGTYVAQRILEALRHAGAEMAAAGEFTRRAFLAGKMTLSQAESVLDVIGATGERELKAAQQAKGGALSRRVEKIQTQLVQTLGNLAAWADYPEDEDIPGVSDAQLMQDIEAVEQALQDTLSTYHYGRVLREGLQVAILGKPNVGKSTLFNQLYGGERSIVTQIPGTTRDVVEETVRLGDLTLTLSDTAGIRETEDVVEQLGIARSRAKMAEADVLLVMLDGSAPWSDEDTALLEDLPDTPAIAVCNKADKTEFTSLPVPQDRFFRVVNLSAKTGEGMHDLQQALEDLVATFALSPKEGLVANARQKACLDKALESVQAAKEAHAAHMPLDAVTILLDEAADALLELDGQRVSDAVVDDVFSRFCVGK